MAVITTYDFGTYGTGNYGTLTVPVPQFVTGFSSLREYDSQSEVKGFDSQVEVKKYNSSSRIG